MTIRTAFIGIGSNLGDRRENIAFAERELGKILNDLKISTVVESDAVDAEGRIDPRAPKYLNAAVRGTTSLKPEELLDELKKIEVAAGRDPKEKSLYLPRALDLDLLQMEKAGAAILINTPNLTLPHPRIAERPFVTRPLAELIK